MDDLNSKYYIIVMVLLVMQALVHIVCNILKTRAALTPKPTVGENLGTITEKLSHIEDAIKGKQDASLCDQLHKDITGDLDRVEQRHSGFEKQISSQLESVFSRLNAQTREIAKNGGKLDTFINEMTNWRNNHGA